MQEECLLATGPSKGAIMAMIIDFAQAREAAEPKARTGGHDSAELVGEVVLFTGVQYERQAHEPALTDDTCSQAAECPTRKKKNS